MTKKPLLMTAVLCWLGWVIDFYDLILIAFLIPTIEASLHIDSSMGVWLLGVGLGASGLGGIVFAFDHFILAAHFYARHWFWLCARIGRFVSRNVSNYAASICHEFGIQHCTLYAVVHARCCGYSGGICRHTRWFNDACHICVFNNDLDFCASFAAAG